ncbi:MAG TPA: hypothetical protein VJ725_08065 [Thermoanaerobaculia bacterium]|nr:hypothetical protein [Thermoanaerobaculia bacterium]
MNNHLTREFPRRHWILPDRETRQDLISEISLRWFSARIVEGRLSKLTPSPVELEQLATEAWRFIGHLRGSPNPELPSPSRAEIQEAKSLTEILVEFSRFRNDPGLIVPRPSFAGCGLLSACHGDVLIGQTLYEIKSVDRGSHQPDLRQIVVYCALNFASPQYDIRRVGLLNPRRGTYFDSDLEWLIQNLSGKGSAELFYEILDFLSTERVSV